MCATRTSTHDDLRAIQVMCEIPSCYHKPAFMLALGATSLSFSTGVVRVSKGGLVGLQ
jgi:hypothetical protein